MIEKVNFYFSDFRSIIISNKFKTGWQKDNIDGYQIRSLYHKYNTKDQQKCIWESHRNTIDLQFCYSGSEKIYFSEYSKSFKRNKYIENIDKDIWFQNGEVYQHIILRANTFVVFFSDCLHQPQVKTKTDNSIEKIVLKIPAEML